MAPESVSNLYKLSAVLWGTTALTGAVRLAAMSPQERRKEGIGGILLSTVFTGLDTYFALSDWEGAKRSEMAETSAIWPGISVGLGTMTAVNSTLRLTDTLAKRHAGQHSLEEGEAWLPASNGVTMPSNEGRLAEAPQRLRVD